MCIDPATMTLIAAAASVAATAVSTIGQLNQATYEARVARENARMADLAAADAIQRGKMENLMLGREVGQIKGQQEAKMAANGIEVSFGSGLRTLGDTAVMGAEDAWMIQENARREAMGLDISAANYRAQANAASNARAGIIAGGVKSAASTIMGAAQQQEAFRAQRGQSTIRFSQRDYRKILNYNRRAGF